jgi:hypothetical protein
MQLILKMLNGLLQTIIYPTGAGLFHTIRITLTILCQARIMTDMRQH